MIRPSGIQPPHFFVLIAVILCVIGLYCYGSGMSLLTAGPGKQVAETARWFWHHGDLSRPEFSELREHLYAESMKQPGSVFWQDVFAESQDGTLYPKHPLIISLSLAPFYGLLGEAGFWLFNQLALLALLWGFFALAKDLSDEDTGIKATLLLCVTTPLIPIYSYTLSYDLHAAALLVAGLALMRRYPFLGMCASGASLFIRVSNVIYLPFLALATLPAPVQRKEFIQRTLLGVLLVVILFFLTNMLLWGNPLHSSYHHLPMFQGGRSMPDTAHYFSSGLVPRDLMSKLFGLRYGLITYNPFLILWPVGIFLIFRLYDAHDRRRRTLLSLQAGALLSMIVIFGYSHIETAGRGNRFLLPAVVLLATVFVPLLRAVRKRGEQIKDTE